MAVLEIACGTGYWTRFVAPCARNATATDFSEEILEVAGSQQIANARFLYEGAYRLKSLESNVFDFGFAMHWLSHIPLARWDEFFCSFHARLKPGAKVLMAVTFGERTMRILILAKSRHAIRTSSGDSPTASRMK